MYCSRIKRLYCLVLCTNHYHIHQMEFRSSVSDKFDTNVSIVQIVHSSDKTFKSVVKVECFDPCHHKHVLVSSLTSFFKDINKYINYPFYHCLIKSKSKQAHTFIKRYMYFVIYNQIKMKLKRHTKYSVISWNYKHFLYITKIHSMVHINADIFFTPN